MILIEAGPADERAFEAKIQFAHQLAARGHGVFIDAESMPEGLVGPHAYDAVRLLADRDQCELSQVFVIGAERLDDAVLARLRSLRLAPDCPVRAIGRFETHQALVATRSRLAYALGFEPGIIDLAQIQPKPIRPASVAPLFGSARLSRTGAVATARGAVRLLLVLPEDMLEEGASFESLEALSHLAEVELAIVTSGHGKDLIRKSGLPLPVTFGFAELAPDVLARLADMVAVFGSSGPGEQMAALCLNTMCSGGVVVDCTETGAILASGAPALRGPVHLLGLLSHVQGQVLPNLSALGREVAEHPWVRANDMSRLEQALGLAGSAPESGRPDRGQGRRVIFMPTNGVGLGHAQRSSLVAAELGAEVNTGFAAYPSCIPLLQSKGFDCLPLVARSDLHAAPFANDLVNHLRLGQILQDGDTLVFDGGYVFDSVFRTILEKSLNGVWIRRGLWQPGQLRRTPMDREAFFSRVIVPLEAFEDLNTDYSFGFRVHRVGPIVQGAPEPMPDRSAVRSELSRLFERPFEKLVVSMLGGGVAADRTAQLQTLCAQIEARPDCLHLMVVWPSGRLAAGLHGWSNSFPVTTQRALELCLGADLVVSAAGYNAVHEMLYHAIPAIFIPQMASFMDDQARRATAMAERDLGAVVGPEDLLLLQREVAAFLDGDKAQAIRRNLAAAQLPERGNSAAARLIMEVAENG